MVTTNAVNLFAIVTSIATSIGVAIAAFGVFRNTENAKKRATIDLIMIERNDEKLQNAIKEVNDLAKTPGCVLAAYSSEDESMKDARGSIIRVLNQREFVSAGVLSGSFHGKLYKSFEYSLIMRDWSNLSGFIFEIRKLRGTPTLFQEFETLVKKWKKKPLKVK